MPVNINLRTKIIINGKEYSSPDELPPELRKAYDQALAERVNSAQMKITSSSKFTYNGQTYNSREDIPEEARHLYDAAMETIDKDHDGIPDPLQISQPGNLADAGTSTPMAPLPAQQSPITPDRPGSSRAVTVIFLVLIILLAVAFLYFRFSR
jgi:hypothetical protein